MNFGVRGIVPFEGVGFTNALFPVIMDPAMDPAMDPVMDPYQHPCYQYPYYPGYPYYPAMATPPPFQPVVQPPPPADDLHVHFSDELMDYHELDDEVASLTSGQLGQSSPSYSPDPLHLEDAQVAPDPLFKPFQVVDPSINTVKLPNSLIAVAEKAAGSVPSPAFKASVNAAYPPPVHAFLGRLLFDEDMKKLLPPVLNQREKVLDDGLEACRAIAVNCLGVLRAIAQQPENVASHLDPLLQTLCGVVATSHSSRRVARIMTLPNLTVPDCVKFLETHAPEPGTMLGEQSAKELQSFIAAKVEAVKFVAVPPKPYRSATSPYPKPSLTYKKPVPTGKAPRPALRRAKSPFPTNPPSGSARGGGAAASTRYVRSSCLGGYFRGQVGFGHCFSRSRYPSARAPSSGPRNLPLFKAAGLPGRPYSEGFPSQGLYPAGHSLHRPVYFPLLSGGQGFGGTPVYPRPVLAEQEHSGPPLQTRILGQCPESVRAGRLDGQIRPAGCILQCQDQVSGPQAPQILVGGVLMEFLVMPNGLKCAPYVFTMVLKPIVGYLRSLGLRLIIYLDDLWVTSKDQALLQEQMHLAVATFQRLGFQINRKKSVLIPGQELEFLGFIIHSPSLTYRLRQEKLDQILSLCRDLYQQVANACQTEALLLNVLPPTRGSQEGIKVVVRQPLTPSTWEDPRAGVRPGTLLRCLSDRLGCRMRWRGNSREMGPSPTGSRYQSPRVPGSHQGLGLLHHPSQGCQSQGESGQRDCKVVCQEDGRHQIMELGGIGPRFLGISLEQGPPDRGRVHLDKRESGSGPVLQGDHGPPVGLVVERAGVQESSSKVGTTEYRSVRFSWEQESTQVSVLVERRISSGSGCVQSQLGQGGPPLRLPQLQCNSQGARLSAEVPGNSADPDCTSMENETLVSNDSGTPSGCSSSSESEPGGDSGSEPGTPPPESVREAPTCGMEAFLQTCRSEGFSEPACQLMASRWAPGTQRTYNSAWKVWLGWCAGRDCCPLSPSVIQLVEFLVDQQAGGAQYRYLGVLRSTVSMLADPIEGVRLGEHPRVNQLFKGFYRKNPPRSRYSSTWSIDTILDFYRRVDIPNAELSLKEHTIKLALLLGIYLLARAADLNVLLAENYAERDHKIEILLATTMKQQRSGTLKPISIYVQEDVNTCPVATFLSYVHRTREFRERRDGGARKLLFLSLDSRHVNVKSSTISKWILFGLEKVGVDISTYKAHSLRGAAASTFRAHGMSLARILKRGRWSTMSVFKKHYLRDLDLELED